MYLNYLIGQTIKNKYIIYVYVFYITYSFPLITHS